MTAARARAGLIGGLAGLAPLLVVILLTKLEVLSGDAATPLALGAFLLSIFLGGALAGWRAGQARRRRSEAKAFVGGMAGSIAALIYTVVLAGIFLVRVFATPVALRTNALDIHPIRVTCAIILLGALQVVVAMLAAQFSAKPLPPPRTTRRFTTEMRAVPPQMPTRQPYPPAR